jgi:hypothetical protein
MSNTPSRTHKDRHHHNSSSTGTAAPPAPPANSAEPASTGSGFALQDHPGGKSFAAQFKDYSYASFGAIREGHYTEF